MTLLSDLVLKADNQPWDWSSIGLSSNTYITSELVERYINKFWCWGDYGLSSNKAIKPDFVEKYIDKPWSWGVYGLSKNTSITTDFIEKNIDKNWEWGIYGLSYNKSITIDFIERHLDKPWHWGEYGLSNNNNITLEFIERYIDKPWNWNHLLSNSIMTPEFIKRHLDKDWSLLSLDLNENTDDDLIQIRLNRFSTNFSRMASNLHCPNSYTKILRNFYSYKNTKTDYDDICTSYSINDYVLELYLNNDVNLNWFLLSNNTSLDPNIVLKYIYKPWCWDSLSSNTFWLAEEKLVKKKEASAKIIQKNCHNWLWKPVCDDGTVGINPRLSLKQLNLK